MRRKNLQQGQARCSRAEKGAFLREGGLVGWAHLHRGSEGSVLSKEGLGVRVLGGQGPSHKEHWFKEGVKPGGLSLNWHGRGFETARKWG